MVALFGSRHNFLADMEDETYYYGRTPSNADGLYKILQAMLEPEDIPMRPEMLRGNNEAWRRRTAPTSPRK